MLFLFYFIYILGKRKVPSILRQSSTVHGRLAARSSPLTTPHQLSPTCGWSAYLTPTTSLYNAHGPGSHFLVNCPETPVFYSSAVSLA